MSIEQHSAEYIKTKVIDYFINLNDSFIFGNEVMYGTKRKVVDLLMINELYLTGIEIKSATDNLNRLDEQVDEYKKNFNYTFICTTQKHYHLVRKKTGKDVGLLLFSEDTIYLKRKPILHKRLDKKEIVFSMPSNYLRKEFKIRQSLADSDEIREIVMQESNVKLQEVLLLYMKKKLKKNFKLFLIGKGKESHIDDIPLLSLRGTKIVAF